MKKRVLYISSVLGLVIVLAFWGLQARGYSPLDRVEKALYSVISGLFSEGGDWNQRITLVEIPISGEADPSKGISRTRLGELITVLDTAGASLIGCNIPLLERQNSEGLMEIKTLVEKFETYSKDLKEQPLKHWIGENLRLVEERLDQDQRLLESVARSGKVVLAAWGKDGGENGSSPNHLDSVLIRNSMSRRDLPDSLVAGHAVAALQTPYPELTGVAQGMGYGGSVARAKWGRDFHPLYFSFRGALLPSYPLRMAMAAMHLRPEQALVEKGAVRVGDVNIPTVRGELLLRNAFGKGAFDRYSAREVLGMDGPENVFGGKIVLLGYGAASSSEAANPGFSASETAGHLLARILEKDFVSRPPWMGYLEVFILLVLGGLCAYRFPRVGHGARLVWTGCLTLSLVLLGVLLFSAGAVWYRFIYAFSSLLALYALSTIVGKVVRDGRTVKSYETNRLLGIGFQNQGNLDLALEKFKKLPPNIESKELIYNLALEYEQKGEDKKALAAYDHLQGGGGFKDVPTRIAMLRGTDETVAAGPAKGPPEEPPKDGPSAESEADAQDRIGRYKIINELGKGAMGLVYKALDPKINRLLAIKTIRFSDEFDEDVIQEIKERFFREAEIAGRLSHPTIVTIYDVGEEGELTYMVMEYLEGDDLAKYISKDRLLPFRKILEVVSRVAEALEFAHKAGVIHRDIKPANIMLLKNGAVKVTDFGIAKAISSSRTKTGVILGTPNYMSPEQIMGQKVDHRSDIFSLGVLFFQLLTGETPFHGDNLSNLLYQITQVKHPSVRNYRPRTPRVCDQIIDRALAKNPTERFRTAGEMGKYLRIVISKVDEVSKRAAR